MHRKRLVATAAAAPLLLFASGAFAETTITTATTTPVTTSGQDVRVTSSGSIKPTVSGPALLQDTSNSITNEGTISTNGVDGSVGMQGTGGKTGSVTNKGVISIVEDYTPTDTDNDGDVDGPFASGTGRYGIRVTGGTGPMAGSVTNASGASINVEGKNSYGISIESGLAAAGSDPGSLVHRGSISVTGENSYGVRTTGAIAGSVVLDGSITARGPGAVGAAVDSNVGGQLHIQNTISATGYRSTSRPQPTIDSNGNTVQPPAPDLDDTMAGGPAVRVAGNVGQGILIDTRPAASSDTTVTDADSDGIPDAQESTGGLYSYGTAPALLIGSTTNDISIGAVGSAAADAYGLISKGTIQADGIYDGKASTALQIGETTGNHLTNIAGGVRLHTNSNVLARAYQANATAIRLTNGANLTGSSTLWNSGTITAQLLVVTPVATTTPPWFTATGIQIDAGATVHTIKNDGTILSQLAGANSYAIGIKDLSGSLTSIQNTGTIRSQIVANDAGLGILNGRSIAIDVSANTSGVSVVQDQSSVENAAAPLIAGDVLFGSGADTLTLNAGALIGEMDFGAGADTLNINGGAIASGKLTDTDGALAINVNDGKLLVGNAAQIDATSLNVGANGSLVVGIDATNNTVTEFNVDTANFATGAQIGAQLTGGLLDFSDLAQHNFTIVRANTLTAGTINDSLLGLSPYIYKVGVAADTTAGTVDITIRRRTAQEAGLNLAETGAYDAFYAALGGDTGVRDVFLAQATREGFLRYYDQLLPEQEEGLFSALDYAASDIAQTVATRPDPRSHYGPDSFWIHEINTWVKRDTTDTLGSSTKAFGFVGGYESMSARGGALGATLAYMTAEERDKPAEVGEHTGASLFELGAYWRQASGPWLFSVRGGGGYVMLDGVRKFIAPATQVSPTPTIRTSKASWSGYTGSASASAAYEAKFGRYYVRPTLAADYFYLSEGGYTEKSNSDAFKLHVDSRSSYRLAGVAKVVIGADYGREVWWRPELTLGYRNVFAGQLGETVASFGSGTPFTLAAADPKGGAAIVGLALRAGTPMSYVAAEVQMEKFRHEYRYNALLSGRVMF
ncbi:MAG: autotransporter domain-containing protein [Parcubacteria group bacterium]